MRISSILEDIYRRFGPTIGSPSGLNSIFYFGDSYTMKKSSVIVGKSSVLLTVSGKVGKTFFFIGIFLVLN